jgi:Holliday junction resolvase RusA-like endonuclease
MLPFEFTIKGIPVSTQTRNRPRLREWKGQVNAAAQAAMNTSAEAVTDSVCVTITYYYDGDSPDVDNIIKPIQDGLNGVVFVDDTQVVEIKSRKKSINGSYQIRGISSTLLEAFSDGDAFVHIKVNEATNPEVLD